MVIKGNARGSPGDLAKHLQRLDTNERMEVKELRGVVAHDLSRALREMDAQGAALRTTRTLYHASINTRADERLTEEQRTQAIDRLEAALGLTGQPRAIVVHEKFGREHCHVVWARTDLEHMRAIRCDHNYRKHEEVARHLEREFGHARVQGAHAERAGEKRPERTPSHAEMQQAQRSGVTPQQAKKQITALWQRTDNGKAFAAALEQEGWILARGDRRDFVAIDREGETHSLARRIDGAKAKDVRERLADLDVAALPTVDQAREQQRARQAAREEARPAVPQAREQERGFPATPEIPTQAQAPQSEHAPPVRPDARPEPVQSPRTTTPAVHATVAKTPDQLRAAARDMLDALPAATRAAVREAGHAITPSAPAIGKAARKGGRIVSGLLGGFGKLVDILTASDTTPKTPAEARERVKQADVAHTERAADRAAARKESEMERFARTFESQQRVEREERERDDDRGRGRDRTR